jgi:hypothetical protein
MATLIFLRCTDNFLAKHGAAVLLDDVAARRHRFAAGCDSNKNTIEYNEVYLVEVVVLVCVAQSRLISEILPPGGGRALGFPPFF